MSGNSSSWWFHHHFISFWMPNNDFVGFYVWHIGKWYSIWIPVIWASFVSSSSTGQSLQITMQFWAHHSITGKPRAEAEPDTDQQQNSNAQGNSTSKHSKIDGVHRPLSLADLCLLICSSSLRSAGQLVVHRRSVVILVNGLSLMPIGNRCSQNVPRG